VSQDPWHSPLWLGTRFRRQPRAHKRAPLRASGVDRSARLSKAAIHAKKAKKPLCKGLTLFESGRALCKALQVRSVWTRLKKRLTPWELI
jgi:hypothetical protein